jgi:hypothetical protein
MHYLILKKLNGSPLHLFLISNKRIDFKNLGRNNWKIDIGVAPLPFTSNPTQ